VKFFKLEDGNTLSYFVIVDKPNDATGGDITANVVSEGSQVKELSQPSRMTHGTLGRCCTDGFVLSNFPRHTLLLPSTLLNTVGASLLCSHRSLV